MEGIALTGKYVYIKYVAILYSIMYKSYYRAVDNGLGIKKIAARIILITFTFTDLFITIFYCTG